MQKFSLLLVTALLASACSKSKVSDEHRDKIRGVMQDVKTVGQIGDGASKTSERSAISQADEQRLIQRLKSASCTISEQKKDANANNAGLLFTGNASITGASCPISLQASISAAAGEGMSQSISAKYQSNDEEFTRLSRIRSFDFTGELRMGDKMYINMSGSIDSTEYGKVTLAMLVDVDMQAQTATIDVKYAFNDFSLSIKGTASGESQRWEINGQEADQDEVKEVLESIMKLE